MRTINTINLGNLLLSLSDAIDLANSIISQHQQRTAYIAWEICKSANLPKNITKNVFIASLLHDAGAITVEEKTSLHNFEETNTEKHCLRGEILLKRCSEFEKISTIVKYHHTKWQEWNEPLETEHILASQIVLLSDYIERSINRNQYILHQTNNIIEKLSGISNSLVHPQVIEYFLNTSKREEFWLDITSPRLYSLLFHNGPLHNTEIDYFKLENISKLFRDIIDFKSPFTATHTSGVSACAEIISKLFGLTETEIQEMKIAGNLHDLGKLAIPNSILEKPDKLTKEEFDIIKCHTYYSYYVINSISSLKHIAEWAAFHHEKLDGSGYPFHCDENSITICSRIMTVADMFTAMAEDRPYRKGMSKNNIIKILSGMSSNNVLDSRIVSLLIDNYTDIKDYVKNIQESTQAFYTNRFRIV
jgi:HD-GYP domain-containing protein (c-di-GMP phosphodiesterase class II)